MEDILGKWDRSNLEMIVAVLWRKNEDDYKMDGERLKGEVVMMDTDYKEKLEKEEHVRVPKRAHTTREGQPIGERMKTSPEEGQMDTPTTTTTTSSSSSSVGDAARTGISGESNGSSRVDKKRKADGEHPEDPEREDGNWMRTEGNKRKTVEEEEESMLRNTLKYLKTSERAEAKKESEERQEVLELPEVEVNEEWRAEGGTQFEEGDDRDPEQVRQVGRRR